MSLPPVSAIDLICFRRGEPKQLRIEGGSSSGLKCEVTAYPLVCGTENRIDPRAPVTVDPGSYLLVVTHPEFETQRFPFVVDRGATVNVRVALRPQGSTPEQSVHLRRTSY